MPCRAGAGVSRTLLFFLGHLIRIHLSYFKKCRQKKYLIVLIMTMNYFFHVYPNPCWTIAVEHVLEKVFFLKGV